MLNAKYKKNTFHRFPQGGGALKRSLGKGVPL